MFKIPTWKVVTILGVCVVGLILSTPNFMGRYLQSQLPEWMRPVNLGLDLQGGSHLLLEVDAKAGLSDQISSAVDTVRLVLRSKKIGYTGLKAKKDSIVFRLRDTSAASKAVSALRRDMGDYDITLSEDRIVLAFSEEAVARKTHNMVKQSIEVIRRRVDEFGTTEPEIQQQGEDRILVQLPGVNDPGQVRKLLGKTAKLTFRLVHPESARLVRSGRVPPGTLSLESADRSEGSRLIVHKRVLLSGENLEDAGVSQDHMTNQPVVSMTFDVAGARKFGRITTEHTKEQLAIILDNKILSAPVLTEPILGGKAQISGNFSTQEANNLAILMRSGALPAPLTVLEERTVGPSLGADSIQAGKMATVIAVLLVSVFMLLVYALFGVVANIALVFNIILLLGVMSLLQTTLTLPGIAGIALTLGMAVDANVLIYERIKEELRAGRLIPEAIEAGYKRAMATIVDSNLTTLIGAMILFFFGSGPIRGFSVTLSMGILISMFTAISLTRVVIVSWIRWRNPKKLSI